VVILSRSHALLFASGSHSHHAFLTRSHSFLRTNTLAELRVLSSILGGFCIFLDICTVSSLLDCQLISSLFVSFPILFVSYLFPDVIHDPLHRLSYIMHFYIFHVLWNMILQTHALYIVLPHLILFYKTSFLMFPISSSRWDCPTHHISFLPVQYFSFCSIFTLCLSLIQLFSHFLQYCEFLVYNYCHWAEQWWFSNLIIQKIISSTSLSPQGHSLGMTETFLVLGEWQPIKSVLQTCNNNNFVQENCNKTQSKSVYHLLCSYLCISNLKCNNQYTDHQLLTIKCIQKNCKANLIILYCYLSMNFIYNVMIWTQ
jgi:hypothetical protein